MAQAQQIVIAQKFVTMNGKAGDSLADAIMTAVVQTQSELEKAGMKGCTAIVRQVVTTGTLAIAATIIMDIMQIAMIQANQEPEPEARRPKIIK